MSLAQGEIGDFYKREVTVAKKTARMVTSTFSSNVSFFGGFPARHGRALIFASWFLRRNPMNKWMMTGRTTMTKSHDDLIPTSHSSSNDSRRGDMNG